MIASRRIKSTLILLLSSCALLGPLVGTSSAFPPIPPIVTITEPANGVTLSYGGFFNFTKFSAKAIAPFGAGCCSITWTSNVDGTLGTGATLSDVMFGSPGTRTVTATAKDSEGMKGSASIVVKVVNNPPSVSIKAPKPAASLFKGVPSIFQGEIHDLNELFPSCNSLTWTSSKAGDPTLFGCTPQATFWSTGARTITLKGVDEQGAKATATVNIVVKDLPPSGPPVVTILNPPVDDDLLEPSVPVVLQGTATDPGNQNPLSYAWWLLYNGSWTKLDAGTLNSGQTVNTPWTPGNNVPFNCGGNGAKIYLVVSDASNQTGVASRDVRVNYGPC